jgi:hypothetical protein
MPSRTKIDVIERARSRPNRRTVTQRLPRCSRCLSRYGPALLAEVSQQARDQTTHRSRGLRPQRTPRMCGDKRIPFRDSCPHAPRPFGKVSFDGGQQYLSALGRPLPKRPARQPTSARYAGPLAGRNVMSKLARRGERARGNYPRPLVQLYGGRPARRSNSWNRGSERSALKYGSTFNQIIGKRSRSSYAF